MYADKIVKSNAVFTGLDEVPFAGGVAIAGGKILAAGTEAELAEYEGPDTEVLSYGDNLIMPGLIDGHEHLWWGAVADSRYMVDITASTNEDEAVEMIKAFADANPEFPRVLGFGWFPATWNDAPLPTKDSLDAIVPDRPVYMICADCHTIWMNTKALEEAGYSPEDTFDGGHMGLTEDGQLNGLAFEPAAAEPAWQKLYDFPEDQIIEIVEGFMKGLASQGVTSISEMSADGYEDMYYKRHKVFQKLSEEGRLTSRVHIYTKLKGMKNFDIVKEWQKEFWSPRFRLNGLKGFLDGVTSTYTAMLLAPYADNPSTCGDGCPLIPQDELNAGVIEANRVGLPVRLHCIGDGAVRMGLDAFEASIKANGRHGLPNTIEHIESADPADIPRFVELDVIASMQGEHLPQENNEKLLRIGEERCRHEWPFRSIVDTGATLAFGTDFPVVFYNQFPGIYAGVARRNYDGSVAGADNGEKLTLAEAIRANTLGSAKVYGREDELGTLEAGKLADVIVLDRNIFERPEEEIKDAKVVLTMVDGEITHQL